MNKNLLLTLLLTATLQSVAAIGMHQKDFRLSECAGSALELSQATLSIDRYAPSLLSSREIQAWDFNYYGEINEETVINLLGLGSMATVRLAIAIPGEVVKKLEGKVIPLTSFLVGKNSFRTFKPFIALGDEELLGEPSRMTSMSYVENNWTDWELEDPYIIPATDGKTPIYIGYEIKMTTQSYPIAINPISSAPAEAFIMMMNEQITSYASSYGALMIDCLIMGEDLPNNLAAYTYCEDYIFARPGEIIDFSTTISNLGINDITSITLSYSVDSDEEHKIVKDLDTPIASMASAEVVFELPVFEGNGIYYVKSHISAVNDVPATSSVREMTVKCIEEDKGAAPHMLIEELTGTWCGYCPLGIVGLETIKEELGDIAIPIAIHYNDEFENRPYALGFYQDFNFSGSYPSCFVNRLGELPPYAEVLESIWSFYGTFNAFASITPTATISESTIHASALTEFVLNREEANENLFNNEYKVAFVLLENGVKSIQANFIPQKDDLELPGWDNYDYLVDGTPYNNHTFNEIARGIHDFSGIEESAMKGLGKNTFNYDFEIPSTVTNKDNLQVVAMLIESKSGVIENAGICYVTEDSAIETLATDTDLTVKGECGRIIINGDCRAASVFDATGRLISAGAGDTMLLNKGIYMVRTLNSNGRISINKVVVR